MLKEDSITGCLLGTAVGDALGLPLEAIPKQRQVKMFPDIDGYHFFFNKGMVSDDTEHMCLTAQALISSAGDGKKFADSLAWELRFWLLGLPAGVGFATLRANIKLWLGFPPGKSGVFSAGNGPAMRSPIIGVCYGNDTDKLKELVKISTRITHTDPKAELGALAVALAAYLSSQNTEKDISPQEYYQQLQNLLADEAPEFMKLILKVTESLESGQPTEVFLEEMKLTKGVSGYIYQTVPAVIYTWLKHQKDYKSAIQEIIRFGGDTDTTAAILGAIIGAGVGIKGIPQGWLSNLFEWPRNVEWIKQLSKLLSKTCEQNTRFKPLPVAFYGIFLRNILFMVIVLCHGFRRALPPY